MKIEIEKLSLTLNQLYFPDHYPKSGLFNVDGQIMYVNKSTGVCLFLDNLDQFTLLSEDTKLTENFVLRLLAVSQGKVDNLTL